MKFIPHVFIALITFILTGCGKPELKNGIWRATVTTQSGAQVPFNFTLSDSAGTKLFYLIKSTNPA